MLTEHELLVRLIKLLISFDTDGKDVSELYKCLTSATSDFVKSRLCVASWQAQQGYDMTALVLIMEAAFYTATQTLGLYTELDMRLYFENSTESDGASSLTTTYETWAKLCKRSTLSQAVDHYKQTMGHTL